MVLDTACLPRLPALCPYLTFLLRLPMHQRHTRPNLPHSTLHTAVHPIHRLQTNLRTPDIPLITHTVDT